MTWSVLVTMGCLLLTSYSMATITYTWDPNDLFSDYFSRVANLRDACTAARVADVKEALTAAQDQVNEEAPPELSGPRNKLLSTVKDQLGKAESVEVSAGPVERGEEDGATKRGGIWGDFFSSTVG